MPTHLNQNAGTTLEEPQHYTQSLDRSRFEPRSILYLHMKTTGHCFATAQEADWLLSALTGRHGVIWTELSLKANICRSQNIHFALVILILLGFLKG